MIANLFVLARRPRRGCHTRSRRSPRLSHQRWRRRRSGPSSGAIVPRLNGPCPAAVSTTEVTTARPAGPGACSWRRRTWATSAVRRSVPVRVAAHQRPSSPPASWPVRDTVVAVRVTAVPGAPTGGVRRHDEVPRRAQQPSPLRAADRDRRCETTFERQCLTSRGTGPSGGGAGLSVTAPTRPGRWLDLGPCHGPESVG